MDRPEKKPVSLRLRVFAGLFLAIPLMLVALSFLSARSELVDVEEPTTAAPRFALGFLPAIGFLWLAATVSRKARHRHNAAFALRCLAGLSVSLLTATMVFVLLDGGTANRALVFGVVFWLSVLPQALEVLSDKKAHPRRTLASTLELPSRIGAFVSTLVDFPVKSERHRLLYIFALVLAALGAAFLGPLLALIATHLTLRLVYGGLFSHPSIQELPDLWSGVFTPAADRVAEPWVSMTTLEYQAFLYEWWMEAPFKDQVLVPALWGALVYTALSALAMFSRRYSQRHEGEFGWLSIVRVVFLSATRTALFFAVATIVYSVSIEQYGFHHEYAAMHFLIALGVQVLFALFLASRGGGGNQVRHTPKNAKGDWLTD